MDIHHLRVFLSVFKNKSFSKASDELYLSQPTVSSHIKALEDELSVRLFDRLGRTIMPTKEAELLYSRGSEILQDIEDIKTSIGILKKEITGELVIGASTIPGTYIIPSVASEFKRRYPGVLFQVVIGDSKKITDMLLSHELLIGVVGAKMNLGKIEYLSFFKDELLVVSSPKLLDKKAVSLKEFTVVPFIIREEGSGTRKMMEVYLSEEGIGIKDLNVSAVLGSTESVKEAVKAGLGVSVLSRIAVKDELSSGALREVKIKGLGSMKRDFYIITHKRRTLPLHYLAFVDYLKKVLTKGSSRIVSEANAIVFA